MPDVVQQIEALFIGRPWGLLPSRTKFDAASYPARVRYAAWCISEWENHRNFDTCFEMYDGSYVVAALVRAANREAGYLKHRLTTDEPRMWEAWQRTAAELAHIADADLPTYAAAHRRHEREVSHHRIAAMQAGTSAPQQLALAL